MGKSTVPVGTAARLAAVIQASAAALPSSGTPGEDFAVKDTISPDRLVYGVPPGEAGKHATALLNEVYAMAMAAETPLIVTDYATAELEKVLRTPISRSRSVR